MGVINFKGWNVRTEVWTAKKHEIERMMHVKGRIGQLPEVKAAMDEALKEKGREFLREVGAWYAAHVDTGESSYRDELYVVFGRRVFSYRQKAWKGSKPAMTGVYMGKMFIPTSVFQPLAKAAKYGDEEAKRIIDRWWTSQA